MAADELIANLHQMPIDDLAEHAVALGEQLALAEAVLGQRRKLEARRERVRRARAIVADKKFGEAK